MLVSHSAGLAREAAAFVREIAGDDAVVGWAGGTGDGGLGTSVELIAAAVEGAQRGDGVVVVPDLGSSVLTARLLAEPGVVVVAEAPFVEGALAAAVTAGAGAPLDAVLAAALEAWTFRKG
ncbi:phosphoenolpyruvate--protein phosphotransferase [Nonomuraea sp. NBC_01738]|uniref:PTS-dependent dihydroxyacetone kinase phosphotransferase subunit DhaM n=1 Tax=Nonomuraea sp. NBC_01738 TaxID=2976003 RepID=UPI002E127719|nr:phosphoenolpyruvate--protein phosphotransferase [Nonomuraea sp. NBC_01738]